MSLFVLASKDGWVDIMYDGLDAVGVDQQVNVKLRTQNVGKSVNIISGFRLIQPYLAGSHYLE